MSSVIITGASSGIGRSTAIKLAESGKYEYIAINSGHDEAALIETAGLMRQATGRTQEKTCEADGDAKTIDGTDSGLKVITVFGDISMNVTAKAIATKVMKEAGSIDVLINCAAVSYVGLLMDMTPTEWQKTVAVNLDSVYNTCHEVIPHMVRQKSGRIVNISSVWGLAGASCEAAYSATKGAVNAFTKALAKELAPSGISVNAIAFGAVDTRMNSFLSEEDRTALEEEIPFGRMATADEAALTIVKLLEMPEYLTGEVIKVDGGWI
jgi:3-oxoacyl-[acyl-carrier protein] reductase